MCRLCSLWAAGSSVRRWRCRSFPVQAVGAMFGYCAQRSPGTFQLFPGAAQRPARTGLLIRQAGPAAGRWAKEKGQGRRRGVRCCSGLWSALAAMVPAGCVPVPVVGLICWRCRWAWSALAPFPLSAFQRHGWRWRCSIRAGFGRLPEGSDSPPNGSEKQV